MKLTVETNLERIAAKCCEPPVEERGAGKPHATFCGNRGRATAPGDPVGAAAMSPCYPIAADVVVEERRSSAPATRILDGTLRDLFTTWYPAMPANDVQPTSLAAAA